MAKQREQVGGEEFLKGGVGTEEFERLAVFSGGSKGKEELSVDVVDGDLATGLGELEEGVRSDRGVFVLFDPRAGGLHQGELGGSGSLAREDEAEGLGRLLKLPHAGQYVLFVA
jgi:hypothetical protein